MTSQRPCWTEPFNGRGRVESRRDALHVTRRGRQPERRGGPARRAVGPGTARRPGPRRGGGHAASPRCRPAGHDLGLGPIARARGVRRASVRSAARRSSERTGGGAARPSSTGPTPPAYFRSRSGPRLGSSGGSASPREGAGTCFRTGTEAVPRWSPGCVTRVRSPPISSAEPRREACGSIGPRPRSPLSGCSTSARWCAVSAAVSSACTTWPSAPSRRICVRRIGVTTSVPDTSWPRPHRPLASPPSPTWPPIAVCRSASCAPR